jgi:hypothetical protein
MKVFRNLILDILLIIIACSWTQLLQAQAIGASGALKWLRVNSLHSYFSEQGSEAETGGTEQFNVTFSWPGEYGIIQSTMRSKGMMLGCRNYYDSKVDRVFPYMVTNVGLKPNEYPEGRPICDAEIFKLVGQYDHPIVVVDGLLATINNYYDLLDDVDPSLIADRMLVVQNVTSIGVTVTKKVYAYSQQNHDNYYIYDYILKNTGIIDDEGTTNAQTINDFVFYLVYRYALSGESINESNEGWGASNSLWGRNVVNDVVGTDPEADEFANPDSPYHQMRAHFAWYGPHSGQPVEDDWGCPNYNEDGVMAAARYVGYIVLHADKSVADGSDDPFQPTTTHYQNSDANYMQRASSQYDEPIMSARYDAMTMGHAELTQADEVELSGDFADQWGPGIGGTSSVMGFGPYTLNPGDSLHFVLAGGVAGLSRAKNRAVGGKWLQWTNSIGNPTLIRPNGDETTDYNLYKREWVWTCKDSLLKTFRHALVNYADYYQNGIGVPRPPPPPDEFTVSSGGDKIALSWTDNATSDPHFDGYVIYRSEGSVLNPKTVYQKIFECSGGADLVHSYDDVTANRGFDYYYYIQSKDDGTQNEIEPGVPLYSSMFWTLTNMPAYLRRPAVTKEPKATPDVDSTYWKVNTPKEEWVAANKYYDREIVFYNSSNYLCICDSTDGTQPPVFDTRDWQLINSRGDWNPATTYVTADAARYNGVSYVCLYGLSGGTWLDMVRVVPNPYDIRSRMFQFGEYSQYDRIAFYGLPPICDVKVYTERGDLIWEKYHDDGSGDELWDSMTSSRQVVVSGIYILYVETPDGDSVIRKFVVIR